MSFGMMLRSEDGKVLWPKLLALFVFALALWAQADAMIGVFYDDGIYLVLAKALAEGEGYRNLHLPGTPAAVHYPFFYPFALSLLWRLWPAFPDNVALFEIFDSAVLAAAAWAIAVHARRSSLPPVASGIALALAFTAFPLLAVVGVRLSEPFFLALAAGAVAVADRETVSDRSAVAAGALAGLAALTRSVGVAIIAGVAVGLWVRGQRRAAAIAGGVAALVLTPWFVWVARVRHEIDPQLAASYGTYLDEVRQAGIWGLLAGLDGRAAGPIARLTLPSLPGWIWYPLAVLLIAVVVWGAVVLARRVPALVASVGFYTVVVSLWPFPPDRFLWILLPWIALFAAAGGINLWRRGGAVRVAVAALAVVVAFGYIPREISSLKNRGFARTAEGISRPFTVLVPAIAAETVPDAVVATADEPLMYLYSGRQAVPNHPFRWKGRTTDPLSPDSTLAFFCEAGATYLALTSPSANAAPLSEGLDAVWSVSGGPALFRLRCPA